MNEDRSEADLASGSIRHIRSGSGTSLEGLDPTAAGTAFGPLRVDGHTTDSTTDKFGPPKTITEPPGQTTTFTARKHPSPEQRLGRGHRHEHG